MNANKRGEVVFEKGSGNASGQKMERLREPKYLARSSSGVHVMEAEIPGSPGRGPYWCNLKNANEKKNRKLRLVRHVERFTWNVNTRCACNKQVCNSGSCAV